MKSPPSGYWVIWKVARLPFWLKSSFHVAHRVVLHHAGLGDGAQGDQVVAAGLGQAAQGGAGVVVVLAAVHKAHDSLLLHAAGKGVLPGGLVVADQDGAAGVAVPVVQGDNLPVAVYQDELVEGVAHGGGAGQALIRDGHIGLAYREEHTDLVMQAVGVGIPCVAGVHIEHPVILRTPYSARNKGGIGLGPAQTLPVLGVLHHPDDLFAVVLLVVALAEDQEVVALAGEEAAEAGELCGHGVRREELEVLVVHLHRDGILGQLLHPGVAPIGAEVEIGVGQYGGVCVVLVVPQVGGLGGHGRLAVRPGRQGGRRQPQGQNQAQAQGRQFEQMMLSHVFPPFYTPKPSIGRLITQSHP